MRIKLPDGKIAEFPDTMDKAEIAKVIRKQYPPQVTWNDPNAVIDAGPVESSGYPLTDPSRRQFFVEGKPATGKEAAAAALPIMGDLALTAMAPQRKGAGLGIKMLNTLFRGGGSYAGGAGGELAAQKILGQEPDLAQANRQGVMGAAGEVGGSAALGALKLAGDKVGKPALNLLSELTPLGERMATKATRAMSKRQKPFEQKVTKRAVDFIDSMQAGPPTKSDVGMGVGKILKSKKDFGEIYKEYNRLVDLASGQNDEIILDEVSQRIGDQIAPYLSEGMSQWKAIQEFGKDLGVDEKSVKIMRDLMNNNAGYLHKKDAKYFIAKIHKGWKGATEVTKGLKEQIKEDFLTDVSLGGMTGKAAKEAKKKADAIYKSTNDWFAKNYSADYITSPMRFGGRGDYFENLPEKALDRIFASTPDELVKIKASIIKSPEGRHVWAGAEYNYIRDIYEKAITKTPDTGRQRILPDALADSIYEKEEVIKKVFPRSWPKLKAEADYYKEIAPQFETIQAGDIFGAMNAWEVISPKSKKLLEGMLKYSGKAAKTGSKITLHIAGQEDGTNP